MSEKIERRIIIGMAISTEFLQQLQPVFEVILLESSTAKHIAGWVWEYFTKFNKAPKKDLEGIFLEKMNAGKVPKDDAEDIEDLLGGLSDESIENP
jgi:hypothetical protein